MKNANETPLAKSAFCIKCGAPHGRQRPWDGVPEDLCEACEKARVAEIKRIFAHHERHPEKCCCRTYLGRGCCMAPVHGPLWRANCIENGEKFFVELRAANAKEARELGQELAMDWGGECFSVRKVLEAKPA